MEEGEADDGGGQQEEETGREEILKERRGTGLRNPCISIPLGLYGSSRRGGREGRRMEGERGRDGGRGVGL